MSEVFIQLQFWCNSILLLKIKKRRTIKPPQKYGEADLVAYDLSVANNIEPVKSHPLMKRQ